MKGPSASAGGDEVQLRELTAAWLELHEQGEDPNLTDLCVDRAELEAELRRRIAALEKLDAWISDDDSPSDASDATEPEETPRRIGRFRIVREVGRGGMGVVYEAEEDGLPRRLALKVLSRRALERPDSRNRFRIEAVALAGLKHAHIVEVHEFGHDAGLDFIAMPFIDGRGLDQWRLGRADDSIRAVAQIGVEVAGALDAAHRQGVTHRDVKPSNILIDRDGHSCLVDFGLARIDGSPGPTRSGPLLGSVSYLAPERFEGITDPRGDVYSLGVTLYEALTERRPFEGNSEAEIVHRILEGKAVPPRDLDPAIPRDLAMVVSKAMARELVDRYSSAGAFADDLRRFLDGKPVTARPVPPFERFARWHRRNPALAALVWALFTSLSLGLATAIVLYREAAQQREQAAQGERLAREALAEISDLVAQDAFFSQVPTTQMRAKMLLMAQEYHDRAASRANADAGARSGWALASRRTGEIEEALGHFDRAEANLKRSIAEYDALIRDDPGEADYRFGLFHALQSYWFGLDAPETPRGRAEVEAQRRAFDTIRSLAEEEPANPHYRDCLASQGVRWGAVLMRLNDAAEAERAIRSAMATAEALSQDAPDQPGFRKHVAGGWYELGALHSRLGRFEEAADAFANSARVNGEIAARLPNDQGYRYYRASALRSEGEALSRLGRTKATISRLEEARAMTEILVKEQPDYRFYVRLQEEVAEMLRNAKGRTEARES
jgi:eukaryotic-like serine/threonine-protein kinase